MTKAELLKFLEPFTDECEIVVNMPNVTKKYFKSGIPKYQFAKRDNEEIGFFEKCEGKEKDAEGVIVIS